MKRYWRLSICLSALLLVWPVLACGHSVSEYQQPDAAIEQATVSLHPIDLRCGKRLESKKIATMIGENHHSQWAAGNGYFSFFTTTEDPEWVSRFGSREPVYGHLASELNREFNKLGLQTYAAAAINQQVVKEEQEAFLNNDPEAATRLATVLGADFVVRGLITTRTQLKKTVNVDEVFVTIKLALLDRNGGTLASAQISQTAFSDADILATLQKMVHKQAKNIVRVLFKDYCKEGS